MAKEWDFVNKGKEKKKKKRFGLGCEPKKETSFAFNPFSALILSVSMCSITSSPDHLFCPLSVGDMSNSISCHGDKLGNGNNSRYYQEQDPDPGSTPIRCADGPGDYPKDSTGDLFCNLISPLAES